MADSILAERSSRSWIVIRISPVIEREFSRRKMFPELRIEMAIRTAPGATGVHKVSAARARELLADAELHHYRSGLPRGIPAAYGALARNIRAALRYEEPLAIATARPTVAEAVDTDLEIKVTPLICVDWNGTRDQLLAERNLIPLVIAFAARPGASRWVIGEFTFHLTRRKAGIWSREDDIWNLRAFWMASNEKLEEARKDIYIEGHANFHKPHPAPNQGRVQSARKDRDFQSVLAGLTGSPPTVNAQLHKLRPDGSH